MEDTKIQWCRHTFNGWRGCQHALLPDGTPHPGCINCYAEAMAPRNPKTLGTGDGVKIPLSVEEQGQRVRGVTDYWQMPLKWNAEAEKAGERVRVFALSLGDVFEDWRGPIHATNGNPLWWCHGSLSNSPIPSVGLQDGCRLATMDDLRRDLFALIDETPWLDWLLLTKRPQNVREMWPAIQGSYGGGRPFRKNGWLITSISDQHSADLLLPELLKCRDLVPVLGVSAEPLLEGVRFAQKFKGGGTHNFLTGQFHDIPCKGLNGNPDFTVKTVDENLPHLDWIILGGESGHHARPCDVAWIRSGVEQCRAAGVPVFVKQVGKRPFQVDGYTHSGAESCTHFKMADGKGGDMAEFPEDLRVRQFPQPSRLS